VRLALVRGEVGPLRSQRAHLVVAVHAADELWLPGVVDVAALAQHRKDADVWPRTWREDRGLGRLAVIKWRLQIEVLPKGLPPVAHSRQPGYHAPLRRRRQRGHVQPAGAEGDGVQVRMIDGLAEDTMLEEDRGAVAFDLEALDTPLEGEQLVVPGGGKGAKTGVVIARDDERMPLDERRVIRQQIEMLSRGQRCGDGRRIAERARAVGGRRSGGSIEAGL